MFLSIRTYKIELSSIVKLINDEKAKQIVQRNVITAKKIHYAEGPNDIHYYNDVRSHD